LEIQTVVLYRAAYKPEDFPNDGRAQFAFVGRSNVGKSSLINSVVRRKGLARTSQTPGKTQAIYFYLVNERFYLVDLPGYGYAKVSKSISATWGALIRDYLESAESLRLIFLLLDSRRQPSAQDLTMRDWMEGAEVPWQPILTKVDKLSNNELAGNRRMIGTAIETRLPVISFSKVTRAGVDEIWKQIFSGLEIKKHPDGGSAAVGAERG